MKPVHPILADIAREQLFVPTLETRRSDRLDFHDLAVWQIEAALRAAFDAGTRSVGMTAESNDQPRQEAIPAPLPTPLFIPRGTTLPPGKMFLRLYHGRTDPNQEMDDWGFVGPTFGPLSCYIHTYCCTFRIYGENGTAEVWLDKHDDMIQWDGCFYGDMEIFIAGTDDKA